MCTKTLASVNYYKQYLHVYDILGYTKKMIANGWLGMYKYDKTCLSFEQETYQTLFLQCLTLPILLLITFVLSIDWQLTGKFCVYITFTQICTFCTLKKKSFTIYFVCSTMPVCFAYNF